MSRSSETDNSLPLPRLVLRLGGIGNRKFGSANGIAELPETIEANVKLAIRTVLNEIERCMKSIQEQDRRFDSYRWPDALPGTMKPARILLGSTDRWGIESMRDQSLPVFSEQKPLITLCTGGADGTDTFLEEITRNRTSDSGVEYQTVRISPETPQVLPHGLGIGSIPKKLISDTGQTTSDSSALPRAAAEQRSVIARQRAFGFRAQSEALRHHSDILIAVWDPHAEGKAGGTTESVAAALNERIPVIAIRVLGESRCEIHVLTTPEHLRGLNGIAVGNAIPKATWHSLLLSSLKQILEFPDPGSVKQHTGATAYHPRAAFHTFRSEQALSRIWTGRFWSIYEAFSKHRAACHAVSHSKHNPSENHAPSGGLAQLKEIRSKTRWACFGSILRQFWFQKSAATGLKPSTELKEPTYESWYNRIRERAAGKGMSGVFGDAHRGGILASYFFAALAVVLAVVGGLLHFSHAPDGVQIGVAIGELLMVVLMFAISQASVAEDWNTAYTESRILAEALRLMKFLGPLGVHTPLPRLPYYLRGDSETPAPERMWSIWYFRALVRMAPIRLNPSAATKLTEHQGKLEELINSQKTYHEDKVKQHIAIHHDIESCSKWLFFAVFLCVLIHIADIVLGYHKFGAMGLIVCVGAPALIAALHGLASQIEISRLRQRSSSVATLLQEQYNQIKNLDLQTTPDSAETVWTYTTEVLSTASLMMDETAGWSMLYRNSDIHAG